MKIRIISAKSAGKSVNIKIIFISSNKIPLNVEGWVSANLSNNCCKLYMITEKVITIEMPMKYVYGVLLLSSALSDVCSYCVFPSE